MQKRLNQLQTRITENARVQEGDSPAEDPNRLLAEYDVIVNALVKLIAQINRTNLTVRLNDEMSMTEAIAQRDGYKWKAAMLRAAADAAIGKQARISRTEVKFVAMVNVGSLREEADKVSRTFRELDSAIQAANWTNDLLE